MGLLNILAAAVLAAAFFISSVSAHSSRSGPPPTGIPIPALTHGQMKVVARYRQAILDLAVKEEVTDPTFRRIYNYGNIQATYCLWGVMPGSISDEKSPFNECAHAYLGATKSLLDYMVGMPKGSAEATALVLQINDEMIRNGAAWELCEFSAEPFSTGGFIVPIWSDMLFHWPSLLVCLGVLAILLTGGYFLFRPSRRSPPA